MFKVKDYYYQKAKEKNFLARSIFKLEEIDSRYQVIKKGDSVVDLGYYPGSWIQYVSPKIANEGMVVGVDIQDINKKLLHLGNVSLFKKDVFEVSHYNELEVSRAFDVVLSDMAPSTTGIKSVDQDRSLNLVEKVFSMLPVFLRSDGNMVIKVFDSNDAQVFLKQQKKLFKEMHFLKPRSTRSVSKEFFVIGKGYGA